MHLCIHTTRLLLSTRRRHDGSTEKCSPRCKENLRTVSLPRPDQVPTSTPYGCIPEYCTGPFLKVQPSSTPIKNKRKIYNKISTKFAYTTKVGETQHNERNTRHLIIKITWALLELVATLLVHFPICSPRQQQEGADDKKTAENVGRCERRVKRGREELVDEGDDEDGE